MPVLSNGLVSSHFDIATSGGSYTVAVAPGLFEDTLKETRERIWIVDDFFAERVAALNLDAILIHAEEPTKSLDRMTEVIVALRERGVSRRTQLVAVGGGVVQDVAAFVAAIYMRGVEYIYLPTTLLSMADSCIGGKSSINVGRYKNIVGSIVPPSAVRVDPAFSMTLTREQIAEGLCEAAKIGLAGGPVAFEEYLALAPSPEADEKCMTAIILHALRTKAYFIETDEFDQGERLLLNFGHTFGHAFEAASDFEISHGIGVGLGMMAALQLGSALGRDYSKASHLAAFRSHVTDLTDAADRLDEKLEALSVDALLDAFVSDKKHNREQFVVILVTEAGTLERTALPRDDRHLALIAEAFAGVINRGQASGAPLELATAIG